jgi:hypothetical protein
LSPSGGSATTDAAGGYAFEVAPGDYQVTVEGSGNGVGLNAPQNYQLQRHSPVLSLSSDTVLDLPLPAHRVDVHVQDAAGNPIAGAGITAAVPLGGGAFCCSFLTVAGLTFERAYSFYNSPLTTDASGNTVLWLFQNPSGFPYNVTATPPAGSPFLTFTVQGVGVTGDVSLVVSLQRADSTPPTIAATSPPDGASYVLNQIALAGYTCQDEVGGSGLASCAGSVANGAAIDTSTLGSHTFTVTAIDTAGNVTTVTRSYTVFRSLGGPVDPPPTVNVANAGAGVPVVFGLGGDFGLDLFQVGYPKSQQVECGTLVGPTSSLESTVSSPGGLGYNASTDQYTYVWRTSKSWAGSCRKLFLRFASTVPSYGGGEIVAVFRFR